MYLKHLAIDSFRNIRNVQINPGKNFNLLYGLNGQGKTNFLEAIYLLGNSRSFRYARLPDFINHQESIAQIQGDIDSNVMSNRIKLTVESAGRRVEINGKAIQRASDIHGKLNAVVFSPDDINMIKSGPEARRRYLDRAVYMSDAAYLYNWHNYNRILKQRNHLLKIADKSGIDIWTEQLAEAGSSVIGHRLCFVELLNKRLKQHYSIISGDSETAGIIYRPEGVQSVNNKDIKIELMEMFNRNIKNDERYGTTTKGPHRDDLTMSIDGRQLKLFGSQGQQKSFVLALKMAEVENLYDVFSEYPLLLLDDMSSELDAKRNNNLVEFLITKDIQVFITTTDSSSVVLKNISHCVVFSVKNGNLTFEGNKSND